MLLRGLLRDAPEKSFVQAGMESRQEIRSRKQVRYSNHHCFSTFQTQSFLLPNPLTIPFCRLQQHPTSSTDLPGLVDQFQAIVLCTSGDHLVTEIWQSSLADYFFGPSIFFSNYYRCVHKNDRREENI